MAASISSAGADHAKAGSPSASSSSSWASTSSADVPTTSMPRRAAKRMPSATAAPWENVP